MSLFRKILAAFFGEKPRTEPHAAQTAAPAGRKKAVSSSRPEDAPPAPDLEPGACKCIPGTTHPEKLRIGAGQTLFGRVAVTHVAGIDRHKAAFLAYRLGAAYREIRIPRAGGGERVIHEPCPALKSIQRKLLRKILDGFILHRRCHGFARGRSIVTNAIPHARREMVVSVDIADFFPTITFQRVMGVFRLLGMNRRDCALMARVCTWQGRLPQGAPTSPALANIICRKMDRRLCALAESIGANYTRYADDMTFSGPATVLKALPTVRKIVNEEGFSLSRKKTRIMRRGSRQKVCGIVVNEKPALPREKRKLIRAMLHRASLPAGSSDGPIISPSAARGYSALLKMIATARDRADS